MTQIEKVLLVLENKKIVNTNGKYFFTSNFRTFHFTTDEGELIFNFVLNDGYGISINVETFLQENKV